MLPVAGRRREGRHPWFSHAASQERDASFFSNHAIEAGSEEVGSPRVLAMNMVELDTQTCLTRFVPGGLAGRVTRQPEVVILSEIPAESCGERFSFSSKSSATSSLRGSMARRHHIETCFDDHVSENDESFCDERTNCRPSFHTSLFERGSLSLGRMLHIRQRMSSNDGSVTNLDDLATPSLPTSPASNASLSAAVDIQDDQAITCAVNTSHSEHHIHRRSRFASSTLHCPTPPVHSRTASNGRYGARRLVNRRVRFEMCDSAY